ncbi:hypothetical protein C3L33_22279, partial [Rhododendron williamsianum]
MHVFLSKCSFWLIHSYVNIHENFFYSWSTTYEDLLCNDEPFPEAIPLSVRISNTHTHTLHPSFDLRNLQEMVDFLVDIWQDDGLYD